MKITQWARFFLLWLVMIGPIQGVSAQAPQPSDDEVNAIAREMYCPVCENTPLDVCPSQACSQWRELIREKLALGWSADQIKAYFAEQYGDRVLSEPPARGLHWLIYVLPPIGFLVGVWLLIRVFQKVKPQQSEASPTTVEADDYMKKVEEELQRRG